MHGVTMKIIRCIVCSFGCQNKQLQFFCRPLFELTSESVFFEVRTEVFDVDLLFRSAFYSIKSYKAAELGYK